MRVYLSYILIVFLVKIQFEPICGQDEEATPPEGGDAPKDGEPQGADAPKDGEPPKDADAPKDGEPPKDAETPKVDEPPKDADAPKDGEPTKPLDEADAEETVTGPWTTTWITSISLPPRPIPGCKCLTRAPLTKFKLMGNIHFPKLKVTPPRQVTFTTEKTSTLCPPCICKDCDNTPPPIPLFFLDSIE